MKFRQAVYLISLGLKGFITMANTISDSINALQTQVTATVGVEASAVTLIKGIPALIQAAVDSAQNLPALQAQLSTLQANLVASSDSLAAAVTAQTPVPAPTPTPTPASAIATVPVVVSGTGTVAPPPPSVA